VTPLGKILKIFQEEINIFRNHLFEPIGHMLNIGAHVVVVTSLMLSIGAMETVIGGLIFCFFMYQIVPYYLKADN